MLILFFLIVFSSCSYGQQNDCVQSNDYKCYNFRIDNNDAKNFGFYHYEDDESLGTKALALSPDSKSVFLVDGAHGNIKKIYLSTGQSISSKKIVEYTNKHDISLYDITVFDNKVYVTSNSDIFIFDDNLNFVNKIDINIVRNSDITVFEQISQDSICIFLTEKQLQNRDIEKIYLIVKKDLNYIKDQRFPVTSLKKKTQKRTTLGKEYEVKLVNNKPSLLNQYGCYILKEDIPEIKFYSSRNVDFTKRAIVYFDSTPTELKLFYYSFNLR